MVFLRRCKFGDGGSGAEFLIGGDGIQTAAIWLLFWGGGGRHTISNRK